MHPLVNIAVSAVRQASRITMHAMDKVKANSNSSEEYMSKVELKAEQAMVDVIKAAYPEHAINAKQSGKQSGKQAGKDITWLIDSLDGTNNFLNEFPQFATTIAIIENGRIQHSVIYDAVRDELYTASRGRGSSVNGRRLRVTDQKTLDKCTLVTGFPYPSMDKGDVRMNTFTAFINQCKDIRITGTPSLDLANVAAGRLNGYWQFGLSDWELSAGSLMIQEAGGIIDDMNGRQKHRESGDVITAAPKTFKSMVKVIQPHL